MKAYKIITGGNIRPPKEIEEIFEKVRREVAPEFPSRGEAIYYTPDPECWEGVIDGEVWEYEIEGELPILDAEWITMAIMYRRLISVKDMEELALSYWSGEWIPFDGIGKPYTLPEILVRPDVAVRKIRRVK
jgi:hypothetical protein